jgi:hypothetical protein
MPVENDLSTAGLPLFGGNYGTSLFSMGNQQNVKPMGVKVIRRPPGAVVFVAGRIGSVKRNEFVRDFYNRKGPHIYSYCYYFSIKYMLPPFVNTKQGNGTQIRSQSSCPS